jgi:DinB superfamily
MSDPRYPIGRFTYSQPPSDEQRKEMIADVAQTPAKLRAVVHGLSAQQLDTPYREGGWTVRQVVHHVPDSHMNAYIRFKLAMTENEPTIRPYDEAAWAQLADTQSTPVEVSLALLESLHDRLVRLLNSLKAQDWKRNFRHPELGTVPLEKSLALYAWHGKHHIAHITELRKRMSW